METSNPIKLDGKNTWIFDFDSTLFGEETLNKLIEQALADDPDSETKKQEIEKICRESMEGRLNFEDSLRQRIGHAGLSTELIQKYLENARQQIANEARELISLLLSSEQNVFVISGGFREWVVPLCEEIGIEKNLVFANNFVYRDDGEISGVDFENPLAHDGGKSSVVQNLRDNDRIVGDVVMIGDGMSDFAVKESGQANHFIGCGIYENRPPVREAAEKADQLFVNSWGELREIVRQNLSNL